MAESADRSGVARAIARYAPVSLSGEVAAFARAVVAAAEPTSAARAKALLFAAGKLGTFATSVGLELAPESVLVPSLIERYIVTQGAALGPATRRTLRSNLRNLSAALLTNAPPAPVPLTRERSKAPYSASEIDAYLALADAQPTTARQMRLSGLVALGAGAGLMGSDLRGVAGTDVLERSGGVVVRVGGAHPRVVPVLEVSRLRATWLTSCAQLIGLKGFMDAAGITCTQRLGDLVATLEPLAEEAAVALLGAAR